MERSDRQTDMTKLVVAFRSFANAPEISWDTVSVGRYYNSQSCIKNNLTCHNHSKLHTDRLIECSEL